MADLISREWVLKNLMFDVDREVVRKAQKVDAVEVVRCKECKSYRNGFCENLESIMDGFYRVSFGVKRPNDFCSYGEKDDRGAEDAVD